MTDIDQLLENIIQLNKRLDDIIDEQSSPWMTTGECAEYLKISASQVSRLIRGGYLKSKRMKSPSSDEVKKETRLRIRIHREWADQYVMFGKLRITALERKLLNDLRFPEKREW
jgi:hypothetical protein